MNIFSSAWNKVKSSFNRVNREIYALGSGYSATAAGMNYGSGTYGNEYGNGAKYAQGMSSSCLVNIHDHLQLRQNSRDAMYDSTEARAIAEAFPNMVVETGLRCKPVPNYKMLGITPERAEEWAEDVGERFHMWAKSKDSDVTGVNNFYQNQWLVSFWQSRDNDIFPRLNYSKSKKLLNPLQIGFIDPNQVRGYSYTSSYVNTPGNDGIIRDKNGQEIGYKIWEVDEKGKYTEKTIPAYGAKSGRRFMLHIFKPEYAGQGRGITRFAHALQDFEKLTDYKEATKQKAINQASINLFVENDEKDPSNPLESRSAGPLRQYGQGDTPPQLEGDSLSGEAPVNYTSMPEATITKPGVNLFNFRRGDKLKGGPETGGIEKYNDFKKSQTSSIASSVGLSQEYVDKQFGTSYSANQGNILLCHKTGLVLRDDLASDFCDPTFESWLSEEIAAGRVSAPGWSDPRMRKAWLNCEWSGAPMINIDRVKSLTADKGYVEIGAQTLDDVAWNLNGSSGRGNRQRAKRQYAELELAPWEKAQQTQQVQQSEPEENEDDEKDNEEDS